MNRQEDSEYKRHKNLLATAGIVHSKRGSWRTWVSPFLSPHETFHRMIGNHQATPLQKSFIDNGREASLAVGRYVIETELPTVHLASDKYTSLGQRLLSKRDPNAGRVYLASSANDASLVSIRILPRSYQSELGHLSSWVRQTDQLGINAIQATIGWGVDQGRVFLVSTYHPGEDLGAFVKRTGPLSVVNWIELFQRISKVFADAERAGGWLPEIRPSKILLSDQGDTIVRDWAFSNLLASKKRKLAQSRTLLDALPAHQLPFIAPEVFKGSARDEQQKRSAIYSLGCVAFFSAMGKMPRSAAELILANRGLDALESNCRIDRSDFSADIQRVLSRMLASDPNQRLATFAEVHRAMLGLNLADADLASEAPSDWSGVRMQPPVRFHRTPIGVFHWPRLAAITLIGLVGILACVGTLVYAFSRPISEPTLKDESSTEVIETVPEQECQFQETQAVDSFQLQ